MEMLTDMLEHQERFQKRLYPDMDDWTVEQRAAYIKEMSIHLTAEIHEALYELPFFKPWKDYSNLAQIEQDLAMHKVQEELVDAWHFFMNIMLAADFDAKLWYSMYLRKIGINHKRQDEGY